MTGGSYRRLIRNLRRMKERGITVDEFGTWGQAPERELEHIPRQAKIGDTIACTVNHRPGSWVEEKTEVACYLSTQAAVDFANCELLPSGRWRIRKDDTRAADFQM